MISEGNKNKRWTEVIFYASVGCAVACSLLGLLSVCPPRLANGMAVVLLLIGVASSRGSRTSQ